MKTGDFCKNWIDLSLIKRTQAPNFFFVTPRMCDGKQVRAACAREHPCIEFERLSHFNGSMMLLFLNEKGEQAKEETSGMHQLYLRETMTSSNIRRDIT